MGTKSFFFALIVLETLVRMCSFQKWFPRKFCFESCLFRKFLVRSFLSEVSLFLVTSFLKKTFDHNPSIRYIHVCMHEGSNNVVGSSLGCGGLSGVGLRVLFW